MREHARITMASLMLLQAMAVGYASSLQLPHRYPTYKDGPRSPNTKADPTETDIDRTQYPSAEEVLAGYERSLAVMREKVSFVAELEQTLNGAFNHKAKEYKHRRVVHRDKTRFGLSRETKRFDDQDKMIGHSCLWSIHDIEKAMITQNPYGQPPEHLRIDFRPKSFMDRFLSDLGTGKRLDGITYGSHSTTFSELMSEARSLRLKDEMEIVDGHKTYVLEADTKYGKHILWVDPESGFNARRMAIHKVTGDYEFDTKLGDPPRLPPDQSPVPWCAKVKSDLTVDNIKIEKVDGRYVPISAEIRRYEEFENGQFTEIISHYERKNIDFNPDFDAMVRNFLEGVPDETKVYVYYEQRSTAVYKWYKGEVVDYQGRKVDYRPKKPQSLLGKPLPSLEGFGIGLSEVQNSNNAIFVCFFDTEQRPSRNCIAQLAGRAEQLTQKGVTVVAIQALKMDEKALDKWVRENGVPFPVGTVRTDHEKTRTAWGVKSFPWLILTDADHIVSAEGFAISELDDKLKRIAPPEPKARVVHFPSNRSMGMLLVLDANEVDASSYNQWTPLYEAKGDITVPAGKALRLDLSKDAGSELSSLSALRSDDLTMLFCYGVEIDDDQLRHVSHMTGLRELYLRDTGILGTGLKYLSNLRSLKRLRVDSTHVGDNELAHLSNLTALESLNLWLTPTTDAGMVHVGRITSLQSLVLSRGVGDEGLAHLKGLTSLRYLLTGCQAITDDGLRHLADMAEMESLYLRDALITDAGLAHLKQMKKLKNLTLNRTRITEKGLLHIGALQNLQNLSLPFDVADAGLLHLSKLPSLKSAKIDSDSVTSKGLAVLSGMKSLEEVSVSGGNNTDDIVSKLAGLPGLKGLRLGRGLTGKGLLQLDKMTSLQELGINGAQITGESVAVLAALPSLRRLSFLDMELPSEEFWVNLGKLTSLERLHLDLIQSKITDEDIAHLAGLQSLKRLSVDAVINKDRQTFVSLDVTDKGLGYISGLKSLESLSLHGAPITDEGLLQLSEIPTLRSMDLQGCGVTEQGLQKLKKKLPALRWFL